LTIVQSKNALQQGKEPLEVWTTTGDQNSFLVDGRFHGEGWFGCSCHHDISLQMAVFLVMKCNNSRVKFF
jgi:hypothetical protein